MIYLDSSLSCRLRQLDVSNPDVSMLRAAQIATAPTGLQGLAMHGLQLQNSEQEEVNNAT